MTPPFFIHEKRGDFSTNREVRQTDFSNNDHKAL